MIEACAAPQRGRTQSRPSTKEFAQCRGDSGPTRPKSAKGSLQARQSPQRMHQSTVCKIRTAPEREGTSDTDPRADPLLCEPAQPRCTCVMLETTSVQAGPHETMPAMAEYCYSHIVM